MECKWCPSEITEIFKRRATYHYEQFNKRIWNRIHSIKTCVNKGRGGDSDNDNNNLMDNGMGMAESNYVSYAETNLYLNHTGKILDKV